MNKASLTIDHKLDLILQGYDLANPQELSPGDFVSMLRQASGVLLAQHVHEFSINPDFKAESVGADFFQRDSSSSQIRLPKGPVLLEKNGPYLWFSYPGQDLPRGEIAKGKTRMDVQSRINEYFLDLNIDVRRGMFVGFSGSMTRYSLTIKCDGGLYALGQADDMFEQLGSVFSAVHGDYWLFSFDNATAALDLRGGSVDIRIKYAPEKGVEAINLANSPSINLLDRDGNSMHMVAESSAAAKYLVALSRL